MHRLVETTVYDFSEFQKELEQLSYKKELTRIEVASEEKTNPKTVNSLKPFVEIEVNSADTIQWKMLKGIGPVFANRICKFRNILGGFYKLEQLLEVYGMDSSRYEEIFPFLSLDRLMLRQITLNNTTVQELKKHPYLNFPQAKAIMQYAKQHGPYQQLEDLLHIDLIEPVDFRKIATYLKLHATAKDTVSN